MALSVKASFAQYYVYLIPIKLVLMRHQQSQFDKTREYLPNIQCLV